MMCYPAIDALVKKVDTKYTLVTLAALRARELTDGAPALLDDKGKKTVTVALEEIYHDKISYYENKKYIYGVITCFLLTLLKGFL